MKKLICLVFASASLASCATGRLKQQAAEIETLRSQNTSLTSNVKNREDSLAALDKEKAKEKEELEGKITELNGKLKASQAQIDSLNQSNKDLSSSLEAGKSQLAIKVKELVAAKDELARQLAEAQKELATFKNSQNKLLKDFAALLEKQKASGAKLAVMEPELEALKTRDAQDRAKAKALEAKIQSKKDALAGAFAAELESGQARLETGRTWAALTFFDKLFFEPKEDKLGKNTGSLVARIADAVKEEGWTVRIEAHSDNTPIKRGFFLGGFSNYWELTSARSAALSRKLQDAGVDPSRMTAAGLGEFKPVAPNDAPEGQAANRRIVFVLEPAKD